MHLFIVSLSFFIHIKSQLLGAAGLAQRGLDTEQV